MPAQKGPLWDLIDLELYASEKKFYCNYCQSPVDTNISQFGKHAAKCPKIPLSEKIRCIKNFDATVAVSTDSSESPASFISPDSSISHCASASSGTSTSKQSRKRFSDKLITNFMDRMDDQTQEKAWKSSAKFFFKNALPFNIIKDEHLMQLCKTLRPSFVLPSPHQLRTSLLNQEYEDVTRTREEAIEQAVGVTIVIDGWSNVRKDDIVNIILCTPKPFFYSSTNTEDNRKTAAYLKTLIDPIIAKYGPSKFNAIVSDNAANMVKFGKEVQLQHTNIFFNGCCAHLLSLLIKDIVSEISEFKTLFSESQSIIKTVLDHSSNLHAYKKIIKEDGGTTLKRYASTRFYGVTVMYKSLLDNIQQLKSLNNKEGVVIDFSVQEKIADFRKDFWPVLRQNYILFNKIANLVGLFESHETTLGDVVYHLNNLRAFLLKELDSFGLAIESKDQLNLFFEKRFKRMVNQYSCLANVLHPKYWHNPNLTTEQIATATDFFPIYIASFGFETEEISLLQLEFFDYIGMNGPYESKALWDYKKEDPFAWWKTARNLNRNGKLYSIAVKLLAVRPSNCDVERNFSTQKLIHSNLRNRLGDATVEKLVCVKQHLTTGTRTKKQRGIDFGLESDSDSDATIDNREEIFDNEYLYFDGDVPADIDHTEIVF